MRHFLVIRRVLAVAAAVLLSPATAYASPAKPLTFILAGQSNMVGLAHPIPVERPSAKVLMLNASGRWVPAIDPLYVRGGVGASITFGKRVAIATGRTVQLIPCAYSGTRIAEWLLGYIPTTGTPGKPLTQSDPAEYNPCLARTLATGAHINGVIFYQGETDAMLRSTADIWASQFTTMVADWRRDLKEPTLRVVFAQIDKDAKTVTQWHTVQAQQASISVPGVSMIRTDDLPVSADGLHLTAGSYYEVGRRFASAWLKLSAAPFKLSTAILAGEVSSNGTKVGSGFAVTHPQTGVYLIYFTTPFAVPPAVLVTSRTQLVDAVIEAHTTYAEVSNFTPKRALIDNDFDFAVFPVGLNSLPHPFASADESAAQGREQSRFEPR